MKKKVAILIVGLTLVSGIFGTTFYALQQNNIHKELSASNYKKNIQDYNEWYNNTLNSLPESRAELSISANKLNYIGHMGGMHSHYSYNQYVVKFQSNGQEVIKDVGNIILGEESYLSYKYVPNDILYPKNANLKIEKGYYCIIAHVTKDFKR